MWGVVEHPPALMFCHGLTSGVVFVIQANLVSMWVPFGVALAYLLLKNGYIKNFLQNLCALLAGVAVSFLYPLIYALRYNCLNDMIFAMFGINFKYTASLRSATSIAQYLRKLIISPPGMILLMAVAGVVVSCLYYTDKVMRITIVSMLLFSVVCMSVALRANPIYYNVYLPFVIPVIVWGVKNIASQHWNTKVFAVLLTVAFIFSACLNLQIVKKVFCVGESGNAYGIAMDMRDLMDDMTDNKKVMVLGPALYYNCTDTLPGTRYPCAFMIPYDIYPDCFDVQMSSIETLENDYIIVEFKDKGKRYFNVPKLDESLEAVLDEQYDLLLDETRGNIHVGLYRRKGVGG